LIRPDIQIRGDSVKFLRWKRSTHAIDQANTKRTNQISLKMINQATQEDEQRGTCEEQDEHEEHGSQIETWSSHCKILVLT
jgi:hypothetical protein